MNAYDYIEDYLNEELSGAALGVFEHALQNDPELRQAVERHRDMLGRLHTLRLREQVKKNLVSPRSGAAMLAVVNRRFLAAAAASVLLAAATYFWLTLPPGTESPAVADHIATPPDSSSVQPAPLAEESPVQIDSGQQTPAQPRSNGAAHADDPGARIAFVEAVRGLEKIDYIVMGETRKDSLLESTLNKAIHFLKTEKPSSAIPLLESVLAQNNTLYQDDAEWLLSLAKLGRDTKAGKAALEAIVQNPAHGYRRRAISLLGKLE